MNIRDQGRSCNVPRLQKPSVTSDPKCVLIVSDGVVRRCPFSGWPGLLASADALECILRREGEVLIATVVQPWQAAEFWGQA
jgi:hypothetical protein